MSLDIEERFRSGSALSDTDRVRIEGIISNSSDASQLESLIYIYCRSFRKNDSVLKVMDHYIFESPIPGLTCICLKAATIFWNVKQKYLREMEHYVDYQLYETWYDEVVFCANFFRDETDYRSDEVVKKLEGLIGAARDAGDDDLVYTLLPPQRSKPHG